MQPIDRILDHEELLTLARKTAAAAHDRDSIRVEASSLRLFEAFVAHVEAERGVLLDLPPGDARVLLRGQQRVVEQLVELAIEAELGGACRCETMADDLVARLRLQHEDERHRLRPF